VIASESSKPRWISSSATNRRHPELLDDRLHLPGRRLFPDHPIRFNHYGRVSRDLTTHAFEWNRCFQNAEFRAKVRGS